MRIALTLTAALLLVVQTAAADTVTRFVAKLDNTEVVADGLMSNATQFTGSATFVLTEFDDPSLSPTLTYDVQLNGLDFNQNDDLTMPATLEDDVTAVHIHDTSGTDNTAGTQHALNVYGFPFPLARVTPDGGDDLDVMVDKANSSFSGIWDDADALPRMPVVASSLTLTDTLPALFAGEVFLMVHSTSPDALTLGNNTTIGGYLVRVPEPNSALLVSALAACGAIACIKRRRG